jgi:putative Mn2+ efflux pump MntP
MTDTQIVLAGFIKMIKNFLPVVMIFIVGLAYISTDERRERGERVAKMEKTDKRNVA